MFAACENVVDAEIESFGFFVSPSMLLAAVEVETVFAVVEVRRARAVDEARVGFACVGGPHDGVVGGGGPEARREG